jgi:hypothetical protein
MYRDDREALVSRVESLSRVETQNEALRKELLELRRVVASSSIGGDPYRDLHAIGPGEREVLGAHQLESFPVWAAAILHLATFGLFSLVFYGIQQGRLPRVTHDDPTASKAIGYSFIPFFNVYWLFFNTLRLCDRVTLQYRLRGRSEEAPRGLVLSASVVSVVGFFGFFLSLFTLWPIATCMLQHRINQLVKLGPMPPVSALETAAPLPQLTPG